MPLPGDMLKLLGFLQDPHLKLQNVVYVVGTVGKTSICRYMLPILRAAGYTVNAHIAGNVECNRKRIFLQNQYLDDNAFSAAIVKIQTIANNNDLQLTISQTIAAAALYEFANHPSEINIIESYEGNKNDPTNHFQQNHPLLCILSTIHVDHISENGNTPELNAISHAHLIHPNTTIISSKQSPNILDFLTQLSLRQNNKLLLPSRDFWLEQNSATSLSFNTQGDCVLVDSDKSFNQYQLNNIATALTAINELSNIFPNISSDSISDGIRDADIVGQMQVVEFPKIAKLGKHEIYLSFATNQVGIEQIAHFINNELSSSSTLQRNNYFILAPFSSQVYNQFITPIKDSIVKCIIIDDERVAKDLHVDISGILISHSSNLRDAIYMINELDPVARIFISGDACYIHKQIQYII